MRSVSRLLIRSKRCKAFLVAALLWNSCGLAIAQTAAAMEEPVANDSHFHLTTMFKKARISTTL